MANRIKRIFLRAAQFELSDDVADFQFVIDGRHAQGLIVVEIHDDLSAR